MGGVVAAFLTVCIFAVGSFGLVLLAAFGGVSGADAQGGTGAQGGAGAQGGGGAAGAQVGTGAQGGAGAAVAQQTPAPLTPGQRALLMPDGSAAAPASAPPAV